MGAVLTGGETALKLSMSSGVCSRFRQLSAHSQQSYRMETTPPLRSLRTADSAAHPSGLKGVVEIQATSYAQTGNPHRSISGDDWSHEEFGGDSSAVKDQIAVL